MFSWVLACYRERSGYLDPHIRGIRIDRLLCSMSTEQIIMRQVGRESYMSRLVETLSDGRMFEESCGLCKYFGCTPRYVGDCWKPHPMKSEQHIPATSRRRSQVKKTKSSISKSTDPATALSETPRSSIAER
jgi:hypothetical protein